MGWGAADQSGQDLLFHWLCRFCPLPAGGPPKDSYCALTHLMDDQGKRYIQLSQGFSVGSDTVYLTVAIDLSHLYDIRTRQQITFYWIFAVMAIICALLSYTIAYLLTRPLGRLSQAAREIAAGHWDYRVGLKTGDEIGLLAQDFDSMAERVETSVEELQASMERQEQFVGSFTHELKTPMTSIIGYADLLRSQPLSAEEQRDAVNYIFSEGRPVGAIVPDAIEHFLPGERQPNPNARIPPGAYHRPGGSSASPVRSGGHPPARLLSAWCLLPGR